MSEPGSTSSSPEVAANVAVIYHSRKGTQHTLAAAAAAGARAAGAAVRLRLVPAGDVGDDPVLDGGRPAVPTHDDLVWADGIIWGTPTYYGNVSAPLKQFIDSTSGLWTEGLLADCAVTGMTSSTSLNGGQEATLLGLYRSMYHWGALVMAADPTAAGWSASGGNPYGLSVCACYGRLREADRRAAHEVGHRISRLAERTHPLRERLRGHDLMYLKSGADSARVAVLFQDGDPALLELARAVACGVRDAGGDVRLRRLPPLSDAPKRPAGAEASILFACPDDVAWADGLAVGARPAAGSMPTELAHFLHTTEAAVPMRRRLHKTVTAFGTAENSHAGGESLLLSVYTAMHTWAALIVAPGYTDAVVNGAGGNPYGTLFFARNGPRKQEALAAARYQGRRLTTVTQQVRSPGNLVERGKECASIGRPTGTTP
ncbi:MAG TPA: NAD(P)H-dependent oxidoreductase [Micromonosporaceae bacterium]